MVIRTTATGSLDSEVELAGTITFKFKPVRPLSASPNGQAAQVDSQSSLCGISSGVTKSVRYCPAAAGTSLGSCIAGKVCWMHWLPNTVALIVPLYGEFGFGRRRRRSPTLMKYILQHTHAMERLKQ